MPFDLALSPQGDLIFSGSRDLQGVSGTALLEQRMKLRLRMMRGQWQYDTDSNLGSQLYTLVGQDIDAASSHAAIYVREALRGMDEIVVDDVHMEQASDRSLEIHVQYHLADDIGASAPELVLDLTLSVPLGG